MTPNFSPLPLMITACAGTMAMMAFVAVIGPAARLLGLAPWHVGVAVTASGLAWMLMSRFWGVRSDRIGRRPVLLMALSGFAVSYAVLVLFIGHALAVVPAVWISLGGIVVGRTLAGAFYAAVPPVCAALVADHVPPAGRARSMAGIGAANALGLVAGPGAAGLLAGWSLSAALHVIALLPVAALLATWCLLPPDAPRAARKSQALSLADPRIRRAICTAFAAMFSVMIAQVVVGFYALDRLGLDTADAARAAGIALALVGVSLFVAQMGLRQLRWPPARFIRIGATVGALGFGAVPLADTQLALWAAYMIAAAGMGWVYPSLSALAANAVGPGEQGAAAGAMGAAQGLGAMVGPVVGAGLYEFAYGAPYALVAVLLLAAALWPARRMAAGQDGAAAGATGLNRPGAE